MIMEIRIKLKMYRVPLEVPDNVFCDNNGVVNNTSIPESTLSKKHNTFNYHFVCDVVTDGNLRIGKEYTAINLA